MYLNEISLIAAKVETTEGTAISLANTDAAFWARNVTFTPGQESFERNPRSVYLGHVASLPGKRMATLTFDVDLYGQGTSAPGYAALMQGCGLVGSAGVSTYTYTASSTTSNHKSLTIGCYVNGRLIKMIGARGTVKIAATAGQPNVASFSFQGALVAPSDTSILSQPTYDANSITPPAFMGAALSFGGLSATEALIHNYELDLGNVLTMRTDANSSSGYRSCAITGRLPAFSITLEMPSVSEFGLQAAVEAGTLAQLTFTCGSSTSAFGITLPKLQIINYTEDIAENAMHLTTLTCAPRMNSGDDEISIVLGA